MECFERTDLFLKDPVKHYVAETVVEATLFQINKEGEVAEIDVGVQEHSRLKLFFARTQARHIDVVITKENTNQSAPEIQHESTETEKIAIGSISNEGKTTINAHTK